MPLVLSTGAGAEMRHAMGIAVFAGMIGVTLFGLFLTPVFYVLLRGSPATARYASTAPRMSPQRRWRQRGTRARARTGARSPASEADGR